MSIVNDNERDTGASEQLIERILRAAGPRQELPAELAARWRAVLADELANVSRQRRRRFFAAAFALAVCVALAAVGVVKFAGQSAQRTPARATITYLDGPVVDAAGVALATGRTLGPGATVHTLGTGYVGLSIAGADVRIAEDSVVELATTGFRLVRGRVYVDTGGSWTATQPLVVTTRWGDVSHAGTQFIVASFDTGLSGAVRTGAIRLRTPDASHDVRASAGRAAVLDVDANGRIAVSYESVANPRWQWIGAASPGYPIAGRTALEALEWAARESGRGLEFTSPESRARAQSFVIASTTDARVRTPDDLRAIVGRLAGLEMTIGTDESIRVARAR